MRKYRNYILSFIILLALCVVICFIPIDATRFIPAIESQVTKDLGVKIQIDKLILRLGPSLKVKAPVMHIMYEDGQKLGQFNNVKFFIPYSSLFRADVNVKRLYANKFILRVSSDDRYLPNVLDKLKNKNNKEIPDVVIKTYSISYDDNSVNKKYKISGTDLEIARVTGSENLKVKSIGEFTINDKKYMSFDVSVLPNVKMPEMSAGDIDIKSLLNQMESLDFHSDIIADLKLYNSLNNGLQISGLVNIDNISVLDTGRKSPKSFIYLTFLGDKIGVKSDIYASQDKKVNIDGVINNSKKRSLDLKVKTDEILLQDLYPKIKLLADISKYRKIDEITGKLKADFSIKGDLNKLKSSGFLNISEAALKANGVNIKNITSDIDFSNNIININNAVGYVNDAPIMLKGKIDKNIDIEVLMNKVELKHLLPPSSGVESGIISLAANLSGTPDNITHKENIQAENFKWAQNGSKAGFSSFKIDTNKNNVAAIENIAIETPYTELIKLPLLKLNIDGDSMRIPECNVFMANSRMRAVGEIAGYNSKNPAYNINLRGFVNSRDIKAVKSNYTAYPLNFSITGNNSSRSITAQVLMEKALVLDEPSIVNFVSKIENNNMKIEDLSVSSFSGNFSNDFKLNLKGQKKLIISGSIDNLKEPVFKNLRVFIPQQLNITYLDTLAQLKGDVFINGCMQTPEIVGQITAQNIINQFLQLAINNLTIDFNKTTAVLNAPQIKLNDSVVGVNASIFTDLSNELLIKNMSIKSKYFNTDTFLMYKDTPLFKQLKLNIKDGKFYSEKLLSNIYNSPLYLSALSADFSMQDKLLSIKNISSELFNGKLAGSIDYNLRDENFNSEIQARGVSASPIFDVISTRKESVSGTMDFDTSLNGNLSSKQSLNGNIKFIVHNGRMGSLGKLEHLLYAQNVVADNMLRTSLSVVTRAITLKDTGLFKYLRGDVYLKNGIANVKYLQSQGPLMSLFIKGLYNPDTDYANFLVLGRLSDEIVSGLGAFGDFSFNKLMIMLTGDDEKYNLLPEDFEKIPPLPVKNTKEFRSVINGIVDKPNSVILFNWVSYTQKSYRQKEVPMSNVSIPDFIEAMPY